MKMLILQVALTVLQASLFFWRLLDNGPHWSVGFHGSMWFLHGLMLGATVGVLWWGHVTKRRGYAGVL